MPVVVVLSPKSQAYRVMLPSGSRLLLALNCMGSLTKPWYVLVERLACGGRLTGPLGSEGPDGLSLVLVMWTVTVALAVPLCPSLMV